MSAVQVYLARGKTLGGSSSTNATLYLRGTPADYDSWGLEGWKGQELINWFKNAEMNTRGRRGGARGERGRAMEGTLETAILRGVACK